jgi:hypothetical protein
MAFGKHLLVYSWAEMRACHAQPGLTQTLDAPTARSRARKTGNHPITVPTEPPGSHDHRDTRRRRTPDTPPPKPHRRDHPPPPTATGPPGHPRQADNEAGVHRPLHDRPTNTQKAEDEREDLFFDLDMSFALEYSGAMRDCFSPCFGRRLGEGWHRSCRSSGPGRAEGGMAESVYVAE